MDLASSPGGSDAPSSSRDSALLPSSRHCWSGGSPLGPSSQGHLLGLQAKKKRTYPHSPAPNLSHPRRQTEAIGRSLLQWTFSEARAKSSFLDLLGQNSDHVWFQRRLKPSILNLGFLFPFFFLAEVALEQIPVIISFYSSKHQHISKKYGNLPCYYTY